MSCPQGDPGRPGRPGPIGPSGEPGPKVSWETGTGVATTTNEDERLMSVSSIGRKGKPWITWLAWTEGNPSKTQFITTDRNTFKHILIYMYKVAHRCVVFLREYLEVQEKEESR